MPVGRRVEAARAGSAVLDVVLEGGCYVCRLVTDRRELAAAFRADRYLDAHGRLIAGFRVHLRAAENELQWTANFARRDCSDQLVRPDPALAAKTAAGEGADDPN